MFKEILKYSFILLFLLFIRLKVIFLLCSVVLKGFMKEDFKEF